MEVAARSKPRATSPEPRAKAKTAEAPDRRQRRGSRLAKDYRKIVAWQKCDAFAFAVYRGTREFPREELYGLRSQLRRAALSAPTNIVEGCARHTQKDYLLFLNQAEASLEEAGYLLDFARRLEYIGKKQAEELRAMQDETARVLRGLISRIRKDMRKS